MNFGGRNELERRLRAELQTRKVDCLLMEDVYCCWGDQKGSFVVSKTGGLTDDQARKLGQVLSEGHPVTELGLYSLHGMTATGDYELLMEFIKTHPKLHEICIRVDANEDVASRFLRAVSHSTSIRKLDIRNFNHVHIEALENLLHTTTSISELSISNTKLVDSQEIKAAFLGNNTVTKLSLYRVHPTLSAGIFQSMKENSSIVTLKIFRPKDGETFKQLAEALPFSKGLRQLSCSKWSDAPDVTMMDALKQNGSLVKVTLHNGLHPPPLDPLLQRYLERNRGIQRVMESPGTVPDNLIPLFCTAAEGTSHELDLIFELVKAKAYLFQDLSGEED